MNTDWENYNYISVACKNFENKFKSQLSLMLTNNSEDEIIERLCSELELIKINIKNELNDRIIKNIIK